jgi:D-alanine-D-alanine ligase
MNPVTLTLEDEPLTIGLVYDLRDDYLALGYSEEETAEFDQPGTIDAIERTLRQLGHRTQRVGNVDRLLAALGRGERWDLVFNIAEGLFGLGREALVPAILDHHRIPYVFSDPVTCAVTLHKEMAKRVVRDAGVPTADFVCIEEAGAPIDLPFPLFVKPVGEGTGKGIDESSIVHSEPQLRERIAWLLGRYAQPVLVETLLPGRELTVGLIGSAERAEIVGTLEVSLRPAAESGVYSYLNKELCESLVDYIRVDAESDAVVRTAESYALAAWRALGCRDAGRIDLRCDETGVPCFLEANPLAGLHPEHSDLPILCTQVGIPYVELIARILSSARRRVPERVAA